MRLAIVLSLALSASAQTYNTLTVVPNPAASSVGVLRFVEKSNSPSRHYLSIEGPDSLGANVRWKLDGSNGPGCLQSAAPSGGINVITIGNCGNAGAIIFPAGTAAPQIDGTGLAAAINFNGSGTVNGNIVFNPGPVSGAASVYINTPRTDWPGLVVANNAGTTTGDVFQILDPSNNAQVRVTGSQNSTAPSSLFVGLPSSSLGLVGPSVVAQNVIASLTAPTNASGISIAATPSSGGADLSVFKTGSGTLLPMRFFRNPNELARFDTTNQFLLGLTSSDVASGIGSIVAGDTIVSASATANASTISMVANASGAFISAGKTGSGTVQPLRFFRNPSEVARFDTSNRFLIGATTTDGTGDLLQVAGSASLTGDVTTLNGYKVGGTSAIDGSRNGSLVNLTVGSVTNYDSVSTAGMGVPPIYATASATNQSASIGSTALTVGGGVAPAGLYRVCGGFLTRTAGSGNVLVNLNFTDSGTGRFFLFAGANLLSGGGQTTCHFIHTDGTAHITYSTNYTSSGTYDAYFTLERLD